MRFFIHTQPASSADGSKSVDGGCIRPLSNGADPNSPTGGKHIRG